MKKLMIAAAIVCAAAMSQAATASWSATKICVPDSDPVAYGEGYAAYFIESATYSLTDAKNSLSDGDLAFLSNAKEGANASVTSSGGAMKTGWGSYGNEETVTGYLVILNAGTIKDATLAYITDEASGKTGAKGQAASIAFGKLNGEGTNANTGVASNWYAVPEPTSGLLLLLGVAGLALRRRRA